MVVPAARRTGARRPRQSRIETSRVWAPVRQNAQLQVGCARPIGVLSGASAPRFGERLSFATRYIKRPILKEHGDAAGRAAVLFHLR